MKKSWILPAILTGIILVLAISTSALLIFMKNQPLQKRGVAPLVEVKAHGTGQQPLGHELPQPVHHPAQDRDEQYRAPTYGGSLNFSHLERDPRLVMLFAGYPFQQGIQRGPRAHEYADGRARDQAHQR